MNFAALKNVGPNLTRLTGRAGLVTKQYAPQILTGTGVVGVVVSSVLACRATLEMDGVIHVASQQKKVIAKKKTELSADEYSSTAHKKDLTKVYVSTAKHVTRLYGPSVTLGIVSISCIIGGQGIMAKRNVALVAAYKGLEGQFVKYRDRVVEEYGSQKDEDFATGVRREKVLDDKGEVVKNEDGSDQETVSINPNDLSDNARVFDSTNSSWNEGNPDYNLHFVKVQQTEAQRILERRGWISLNEVYKMLGFEPTRAGQVLGWTYEKDGINLEGDNYVDFRIKDLQGQPVRDYSNSVTQSHVDDCIVLDFNYDGLILNSIPE